MAAAFGKVFSSFFGALLGLLQWGLGSVLLLLAAFICSFFLACRQNPFRLDATKLRGAEIDFKYHDLLRWVLVDFLERDQRRGRVSGVWVYFLCGPPGSWKDHIHGPIPGRNAAAVSRLSNRSQF